MGSRVPPCAALGEGDLGVGVVVGVLVAAPGGGGGGGDQLAARVHELQQRADARAGGPAARWVGSVPGGLGLGTHEEPFD